MQIYNVVLKLTLRFPRDQRVTGQVQVTFARGLMDARLHHVYVCPPGSGMSRHHCLCPRLFFTYGATLCFVPADFLRRWSSKVEGNMSLQECAEQLDCLHLQGDVFFAHRAVSRCAISRVTWSQSMFFLTWPPHATHFLRQRRRTGLLLHIVAATYCNTQSRHMQCLDKHLFVALSSLMTYDTKFLQSKRLGSKRGKRPQVNVVCNFQLPRSRFPSKHVTSTSTRRF